MKAASSDVQTLHRDGHIANRPMRAAMAKLEKDGSLRTCMYDNLALRVPIARCWDLGGGQSHSAEQGRVNQRAGRSPCTEAADSRSALGRLAARSAAVGGRPLPLPPSALPPPRTDEGRELLKLTALPDSAILRGAGVGVKVMSG
jgi:hypothetical protein